MSVGPHLLQAAPALPLTLLSSLTLGLPPQLQTSTPNLIFLSSAPSLHLPFPLSWFLRTLWDQCSPELTGKNGPLKWPKVTPGMAEASGLFLQIPFKPNLYLEDPGLQYWLRAHYVPSTVLDTLQESEARLPPTNSRGKGQKMPSLWSQRSWGHIPLPGHSQASLFPSMGHSLPLAKRRGLAAPSLSRHLSFLSIPISGAQPSFLTPISDASFFHLLSQHTRGPFWVSAASGPSHAREPVLRIPH